MISSLSLRVGVRRFSRRSLLPLLLLSLSSPLFADDNASWMQRVADDAYISQLTIPGTHDSGTGHGFQGFLGLMGGDSYARTQDKTITEQWQSGIRCFDLRPCVDGSDLRINHGVIQTKLTLADALTTLCGLLDQHPSELAIVIIRHETDGDDNDASWNTKMKALLADEPVKSHAVNFTPQLKMSAARGKILILSRDQYNTTPVGGFITGWGHTTDINNQKNGKIKGPASSSQATCYIQDYYDCTASGAKEAKRSSIRTLMSFFAEQNASTRVWCINHTSGYSLTESLFGSEVSSSDGYRDNAATQHAALLDFLADHSGPLGIIVMDFAAVDASKGYQVKSLALTNALIENNFRTSDYARAIDAISNNTAYRIFTEHNDQKCWLTADGHLTTELGEAGKFTFRKVKGEEYGYGFKLMQGCFTNPDLSGNDVVLTPGCIRPNTQTTPRDTWEAQVFLLNEEGRYAIRATNAAGGDSSWALTAKTFWTVVEDPSSPLGITPAYTFDRPYIWQIEKPNPEVDAITSTPFSAQPSAQNVLYSVNGNMMPAHLTSPSAPLPKGIYILNGRKILIK